MIRIQGFVLDQNKFVLLYRGEYIPYGNTSLYAIIRYYRNLVKVWRSGGITAFFGVLTNMGYYRNLVIMVKVEPGMDFNGLKNNHYDIKKRI